MEEAKLPESVGWDAESGFYRFRDAIPSGDFPPHGYEPTALHTTDQMLAYGRECARIAVEAERERRAEAALSFVGAAGPFGDPEVVNLAGAAGVKGSGNG